MAPSFPTDHTGDDITMNTDKKRNINTASSSSLFYTLVVVLEVIGITSIILAIVWGTNYLHGFSWDVPGKKFNYHPLFMVIGMVFLLGNSAISYRVLRYTDKSIVKMIHTILHIGAFIFSVLGLVAVFDFHNALGITNAYSIHSWVGLGAVVLFSCQLLFGFLGFLYPKFNESQRGMYLKVHVFFGIAVFTLSIAACISGVTEKMLFIDGGDSYSKFIGVGNIANSLCVCLIVFALIVCFILYNPSYKRDEREYEKF